MLCALRFRPVALGLLEAEVPLEAHSWRRVREESCDLRWTTSKERPAVIEQSMRPSSAHVRDVGTCASRRTYRLSEAAQSALALEEMCMAKAPARAAVGTRIRDLRITRP